jgi:hypothetical protein
MREKTRPRDSIDPGNSTGTAVKRGQRQKLTDIRQKCEDLGRGAQDSIQKALSGDSQAFLVEGRQQGGQ